MGNCNSGCHCCDGALMNRVGFLNDEFRIIHKLPKYGLPSDQSIRKKRQNVQLQITPSDRRETEDDDDRRETQEETPEKDWKESDA